MYASIAPRTCCAIVEYLPRLLSWTGHREIVVGSCLHVTTPSSTRTNSPLNLASTLSQSRFFRAKGPIPNELAFDNFPASFVTFFSCYVHADHESLLRTRVFRRQPAVVFRGGFHSASCGLGQKDLTLCLPLISSGGSSDRVFFH